MSQKRKKQRQRHEEQEKKRAEKVIMWIIGALIVLALAYGVYTIVLVS